MNQKITFEQFLRKENLSTNTVDVYCWTAEYFIRHFGTVASETLLAYKGYLMENFKPKTVNLRIQAINKYLEFLGFKLATFTFFFVTFEIHQNSAEEFPRKRYQ